jgi:hypothetical protein
MRDKYRPAQKARQAAEQQAWHAPHSQSATSRRASQR